MAETDAQLLYGLGPFGGVTYTNAGVYKPVRPQSDPFTPVTLKNASNIDTQRFEGAASTSFGRLPFVSFPRLSSISTVNLYNVGNTRPYWIVQDTRGDLNFYDGNNNLITDLGDTGNAYTQAVQCDGNMFLNTGQQIYVTPDSAYPGTPQQTLAIAEWQYPKYSGTPTVTEIAGMPDLEPQKYFYAFTVLIHIPTINGIVKQETAPIGANSPYPFKVNITTTGQNVEIGGIGGGVNADGLVYEIRIYRQSTNQPIWFELATTSDSIYIDNTPDQQISGNQQLAFSGQQPPLSGTATWPIAEYLDRMWVFSVVQNGATQQQPQTQLWYSNVGQAWNFDDVAQVLLVGNENTTPTQVNVDSNLPYGRQPSALAKFGSLLIAFRTTDAWFVTGQDQNTFQVIQLFDSVGCIAPQGVIVGRGIMAWPADGGYWTFDGSSLNWISKDIWLFLLGINPSDQTKQVGFYWQNYFCWSFPTLNITARWHAPTQQWDFLPYALVSAATLSSVGSNALNVQQSLTFNQVVGARRNSNYLDSWFADSAFDLGAPVQSKAEGHTSDCLVPHATKTVRYIVVEAPPQDATCTVTLHRDMDVRTTTGQQSPWTTPPIDLSQKPPYIVPVPAEYSQGTLISLDVAFAPNVGNDTPVEILKVEAYGNINRAFAITV